MSRKHFRIPLTLALACCLGAGSAPPPTGAAVPVVRLDEIRARHPLLAGDASSVLEILRGQGMSASLVQVRTRVRAHLHRDHEETVVVLEGRGIFVLGERGYPVRSGSLIIIPRGAVHSYEAQEPTVALSFFNPPFDNADRTFVEPAPPSP